MSLAEDMCRGKDMSPGEDSRGLARILLGVLRLARFLLASGGGRRQTLAIRVPCVGTGVALVYPPPCG